MLNEPTTPNESKDISGHTGNEGFGRFVGFTKTATDSGSTHLQSFTKERHLIIVGPGFGEKEKQMGRTKSVFCFNTKMVQDAIRFQTELPNHSDIKYNKDNGKDHVYENVKEYTMTDTPKLFEKLVMFTAYKDTNLMHDTTTRKSVISITHMNNKTVIGIYPNKQPIVQTMTFVDFWIMGSR